MNRDMSSHSASHRTTWIAHVKAYMDKQNSGIKGRLVCLANCLLRAQQALPIALFNIGELTLESFLESAPDIEPTEDPV